MPASFVSKSDEDLWDKAKKAAQKQNPDNLYALTTDIFKQMGGKIAGKKESAMKLNPRKSLYSEALENDPRDIFVVVSKDGYLYYGSTELRGFQQLIRVGQLEGPGIIFLVPNVPSDLADQIEAMGTGDQKFSDGYKAFEALNKAVPKSRWRKKDSF